MAGENNPIRIFARLKPNASKTFGYTVTKSGSSDILTLKRYVGGIRGKTASYSFRFNEVIENFATQNDIFSSIAKPVINRVLKGYNGTILAYGQTGSGKTYTIMGGTKSYEDRGLVPRALQYLYQSFEEDDMIHTIHISYVEIYNEYGFDLLTHKDSISQMENFPRISVMEDMNQKYHIKNLSLHPATNEQEALNLLFYGEANRVIAVTPMNPSSSRSHCIFTIHMTGRNPGHAKVQRSKLHFVDLAGSERASKFELNGLTLKEAKSINRSLHFLERVTVALAEASNRSNAGAPCHIPYRNSLLTSILRDSLGGNCFTSFIITLAMDSFSLPETLSSCRFSQRAAMIKNAVTLNEEHDLEQEAAILRDEVVRLKEQLAHFSKEKIPPLGDALPMELVADGKMKVDYSLKNDPNNWSNQCIGSGPQNIKQCKILKGPVLQSTRGEKDDQIEKKGQLTLEVEKLKKLIEEKDSEIYILIKLLQHEKLNKAYIVPFPNNEKSQTPERHVQYPAMSDISTNCNLKEINSRKFLQKGTTDEELITFRTFVDTGGPGEVLNKELKEIKITLECRQREAEQTAMALQEIKDKIDELRQKLDESNDPRISDTENYWQPQIYKGENMAIPEYSPMPIELQLRRELRAYTRESSKLHQLQCETKHMRNNLQKVEIQLLNQFRFYWESISDINCQKDDSLRLTIPTNQHSNAENIPANSTSPDISDWPPHQPSLTCRKLPLTPDRNLLRNKIKDQFTYNNFEPTDLSVDHSTDNLPLFQYPFSTKKSHSKSNPSPKQFTHDNKLAHSEITGLSTFHNIPLHEPTMNSSHNKNQPEANEITNETCASYENLLGTNFEAMENLLFPFDKKNTLSKNEAFEVCQEDESSLSNMTECQKEQLQNKTLSTCKLPSSGSTKENHQHSKKRPKCTESGTQIEELRGACLAHGPVMRDTYEVQELPAVIKAKITDRNTHHSQQPMARNPKEIEIQVEPDDLAKMNIENLSCTEMNTSTDDEIGHLKANLPLTGERDVDDEIIAFYLARKRILGGKNQNGKLDT